MAAESGQPPAGSGGELTASLAGGRAAVITGPRQATIEDRPVVAPHPGNVRIAVAGCGVCGSNLPSWQGRPWFDYPMPPGAPGHEAWGHIDAVGDGVDGPTGSKGAAVAFLGEAAFAEFVEVPVDQVVVLPPELDGAAFPGESLGCGFNVAARSGFTPGQRVCVIGIGFLGAVITAIAAHHGAHVVAVSRRPFALDVAKAMGAKDAVALTSADSTLCQVQDSIGGGLYDVVVEAVGAQEPLDLAARLTGESGRLVLAGYHQDGLRSVDVGLWNWRGIDIVNAHERDPRVRLRGIAEAAAAVADGWFDPTSLYTSSYPLERMGDAMKAMDERPDGFLKALVLP